MTNVTRDSNPRATIAAVGDSLPVIELFHSIQGEGTRSGEPATFVRLAGCNLRCSWCDTPYSWSKDGVRDAARTQISELAHALREEAVVITGGEPMLHHKRLGAFIEAARARGVRHVTIETNATIYAPELMPVVDLWSLSPKLPASGEQAEPATIATLLREAHGEAQLKFVVTSDDDWHAMWQLLERIDAPLPGPVLVQPDGTRTDYDVALRELAKRVMGDDATFRGASRRAQTRVTAQVHRVIWGPAARGV